MEELSLDNIMDVNDVDDLFSGSNEEESTEQQENKETPETKEEETIQVTEVKNVEDIFEPESVGNQEKDTQDGKDTLDTEGKETSPQQPNFYSSVLTALVEEGSFPNLEVDVSKVTSAEDFSKVIDDYIHSQLDERQQRVERALSYGIEDSEVAKYERTIQYLDNITEDKLNEETEEAEQLRKNLIYQDFLNRFGNKDRAAKEVQRSINNGTDKEDAIDALSSNKDYFNEQYQKLLKAAEEESNKSKAEIKAKSERLRNEILKTDKVFGDISVDEKTRNKIVDNITKPTYKDKESGELYTALQKYEMDNPEEFIKNVGTIFTLTNGFKDFSPFYKEKVKKETAKGLKALEKTLNNTSRDSSGNLKFVTGVKTDPDAFFSGNWDFDV